MSVESTRPDPKAIKNLLAGQEEVSAYKKKPKARVYESSLEPAPTGPVHGITTTASAGEAPKISLEKDIETTLIDDPIHISLSGFVPFQRAVLELTYFDQNKNLWKSEATFKADDKGTIDLNKLIPMNGEYKKAGSFGLFHLLKPEKNIPMFEIETDEMKFNLTAKVEGFEVFKKEIIRKLKTEDVIKAPINTDGLVGTIFSKNDGIKKPGIIVVPGAQGGIPEQFSKLLASHGYIVFALGYHGIENAKNISPTIELIPLEYFKNAVKFLKKYDQVDDKSIGFVGNSRGGELTLLYGSSFPNDVNALVSYVPSLAVYSSINFEGRSTSGWTRDGKPIEPYMDFQFDEKMSDLKREGKLDVAKGTYDDQINLAEFYRHEIDKDKEHFEKCLIDVTKIQNPLLVFSAEDDKIWPSAFSSDLIEGKLKKDSSKNFRHIKYKDAGHLIGLQTIPNFSGLSLPFNIGDTWYAHGGTVEGNAHAYKDSFKQLLSFLNTNLKEKK